MTPGTTAVMGSQGSLACLGALPGESSSKSLEGFSGPGGRDLGQVPLRGDLEDAGASEWLIGRVEDMLMDHFYRVEASVFKVECGLKAQTQLSEEQQRYMHDLSERLSHVAAGQRSDRARLQDLGKDTARLTPKLASASAVQTPPLRSIQPAALAVQMDTAQHDSILSGLRRDFDEQMARHEDRFASVEKALRQCSADLSVMRTELAVATLAAAGRSAPSCGSVPTGVASGVESNGGYRGAEPLEQGASDTQSRRGPETGRTEEAAAEMRSLHRDSLDDERGSTESQKHLHHCRLQEAAKAV